jgi:hypothetical protein
MPKKKKSSGTRQGFRERVNPLTGEKEQVPGTRSGKKRATLATGHPLRTHDLNPPGSRKKRHEERMRRNQKQDT